MLKNISKLGKVLSKLEQKEVDGGRNPTSDCTGKPNGSICFDVCPGHCYDQECIID